MHLNAYCQCKRPQLYHGQPSALFCLHITVCTLLTRVLAEVGQVVLRKKGVSRPTLAAVQSNLQAMGLGGPQGTPGAGPS